MHRYIISVFIAYYYTAGGAQPDELMQVMLPIIDNDVCNQPGWYNSTLDDSMVCAGYEEGRLGNCHVSLHSDLIRRVHTSQTYDMRLLYDLALTRSNKRIVF